MLRSISVTQQLILPFSAFSALREFVHCKNTHVSQDCGVRASLFMQKHLHKITNPIMDQHCAAYTFGPDACVTAEGLSNRATSVVRQAGFTSSTIQFVVRHHPLQMMSVLISVLLSLSILIE